MTLNPWDDPGPNSYEVARQATQPILDALPLLGCLLILLILYVVLLRGRR
jgi:hypothetical protein